MLYHACNRVYTRKELDVKIVPPDQPKKAIRTDSDQHRKQALSCPHAPASAPVHQQGSSAYRKASSVQPRSTQSSALHARPVTPAADSHIKRQKDLERSSARFSPSPTLQSSSDIASGRSYAQRPSSATPVAFSDARVSAAAPARSTARHARHMRVEWADVSRAVAFFAIVIIAAVALFTTSTPVHVPPTLDPSALAGVMFSPENSVANISSLFGSFALPLLFMSIGYTMRRQKLTLSYIEDLVGKYLIPYVVFGFIAAIIYGIFSPSHDMFSYLASLIYGNGGLRGDFLLGRPFAQATLPVLWLLPTIAMGQIMTFLMSRIPLISRIVVAGVVFLLGSASAGHVFLPLDIQPGACAAWFMTCGMILREQHAFSVWGWEKVMFAVVLTFGCIYCGLVSLGFMTVPDYAVANYPSSIIDMLGGVCAGGCFMIVSQIIALSDSRVEQAICWVGKNFLACLSALAVVIAVLFCAQPAISALSEAIGDVSVFVACSIIAASASCAIAWAVSRTPYLRAVFAHFGAPVPVNAGK